MKKVVAVNLLLICFVYILFDVLFYLKICEHVHRLVPFFQTENEKIYRGYPPPKYEPVDKNSNYEKPPFLMLGCSYTLGEGLSENNNVSAKLSKLTGRHVYNFGLSGEGPAAMLLLLHLENKNKLIEFPPEYIIYTYMFHHADRFCHWEYYNFLRKENVVPFQKWNILYYSHIYQYLQNVNLDKYYWANFDQRYEYFFTTMEKLLEQSKKLYPNSKFVVLLYSDINHDFCEQIAGKNNANSEELKSIFEILYSDKFRQRFKDMGFLVYSTEELIGRKMDRAEDRIPEDANRPHPSSSAWDEVLPKLLEKLNEK